LTILIKNEKDKSRKVTEIETRKEIVKQRSDK